MAPGDDSKPQDSWQKRFGEREWEDHDSSASGPNAGTAPVDDSKPEGSGLLFGENEPEDHEPSESGSDAGMAPVEDSKSEDSWEKWFGEKEWEDHFSSESGSDAEMVPEDDSNSDDSKQQWVTEPEYRSYSGFYFEPEDSSLILTSPDSPTGDLSDEIDDGAELDGTDGNAPDEDEIDPIAPGAGPLEKDSEPVRRSFNWLFSIRVVFFVLLAGNLGFYAWSLSQKPRQSASVQLPVADPGVPELQLIREREEQLLVSGGDLGGGTGCFALGPFQTQTDLLRAFNAMAPFVAQSRQRQEVQTIDRGFWVYLQAVSTREEALNLARDLSLAGLKDYYVVTAGDRENTVSLGLFREEANALRRQSALLALGFDAQMTRRTEEALVFWLDYRRDETKTAPWERVVASNPSVSQRPIACFR